MRILFVAIGESVHTARWLSQIADEGWDLHLFPSEVGLPHKDYRNVTIHSFYKQHLNGSKSGVRELGIYWPLSRGAARIKQFCELTAPQRFTQASRLARTIRKLKPDVVHVLEMQNAGYLTVDARKLMNGEAFPPCIYSSWGSDIFLYGRQPEHAARIRAFLSECDYFIADCARDLTLPAQFGFRGDALGVFTTAGGYDLPKMRQFRKAGLPSSRRVIALKGQHGIRQTNSLAAVRGLQACGDLLKNFELRVYSTSDEIRPALKALSGVQGLKISEMPALCSHDEILKLIGEARVAIGISASDGTPNAMLEAMVLGALPVQSDTISTAEWIQHGGNGLLVSPSDIDSIIAAIRRALTDDKLVDEAALVNEQVVNERLDLLKIRPKVIDLYKK